MTPVNQYEMDQVTFFNEDTGNWSFYGSKLEFETQVDAYNAYLKDKG